METPGLDDASMPLAKLPSVVFSAAASRLAAFSSTIQAVRPRTNTAEGRVLAPLKFRIAPVAVTVLSVTWVRRACAAVLRGGGVALAVRGLRCGGCGVWHRLGRSVAAARCVLHRGFCVAALASGLARRFGRRGRGFGIGLGVRRLGGGLKLFGGVGDGGGLGAGDAGLLRGCDLGRAGLGGAGRRIGAASVLGARMSSTILVPSLKS